MKIAPEAPENIESPAPNADIDARLTRLQAAVRAIIDHYRLPVTL